MQVLPAAPHIARLPGDVLILICQQLELEDIVALQDANSYLDEQIDEVFFTLLRKMRVSWDEKGAIVTLSPRRAQKYLTRRSFSIHSSSSAWNTVVRKARLGVNSLTICRAEHDRFFSTFDRIAEADLRLQKLAISINRDNADGVCFESRSRNYYALTNFVSQQAKTLDIMKLHWSNGFGSSSESNGSSDEEGDDVVGGGRRRRTRYQVVFDRVSSDSSRLLFAHTTDMSFQQRLLIPIFNAFCSGKPGPSSLDLHVNWDSRLDLALQSAFMIALPYSQRAKLRTCRLTFGNQVSGMSAWQIHASLERFSSSLEDFQGLRELHADFTCSKLDPACLERTIVALSAAMTTSHRIRLCTSMPPPPEPDIRKEWRNLPRVY